MQGTKSPTFRPTVWPADLPNVPEVLAVEHIKLAAGVYAWSDVDGIPVDMPPDFVFRELLEVELDEASLMAFVNRWGILAGIGDSAFHYFRAEAWADARQRHNEAQERLGRADIVTFEAIELAARTLRALARHLLAYLDGADEEIVAAWERAGEAVTKAFASDLDSAWLLWELHLNRGLSAFHVHVRTGDREWGPATRPSFNLYNACCLQLVQYLADHSTVKRCANERCRQPFTRQRGRARDDYGQHRTRGVRYCSHLCAKAQSERDRRRRRAAEAEPSKERA